MVAEEELRIILVEVEVQMQEQETGREMEFVIRMQHMLQLGDKKLDLLLLPVAEVEADIHSQIQIKTQDHYLLEMQHGAEIIEEFAEV